MAVMQPARQAVRLGVPVAGLFSAAILGSAFLLFAVEPMVSRQVLPRLGGSPAVWNSCVLFFQMMLLAGYAYADMAARLRPRVQLMVHAAVLGAAMLFLPVGIGEGGPPPWLAPPLWLLLRLGGTIGLPFVALAATAPLLQSWFPRAPGQAGRDPYVLYAASNAGSLAALLAYPVLIETTLGLAAQRALWSAGFVVVALLVGGCGFLACAGRDRPLAAAGGRGLAARPAEGAPGLAGRGGAETAPGGMATGGAPIGSAAGLGRAVARRSALGWVWLAFLPSGLMLAVTTHIASDVASAPLFWVLPLALYIGTFMVAFGRTARPALRWLPRANAVLLLLAGASMLVGTPNMSIMIGSLVLSLAAFTSSALLFHGELARRRPAPEGLTRYFLLISLGGALGGVLNGLVAPLVFNGPWEYPILLFAAAAFRPEPGRGFRLAGLAGGGARGGGADGAAGEDAATGAGGEPATYRAAVAGQAVATQAAGRRAPWWRPLLILAVGLVLLWAGSAQAPAALRPAGQVLRLVIPGLAALWLVRGGVNLAIGMAVLIALPLLQKEMHTARMARSFFGTYRVIENPAQHLTVMEHGTTLHGMESTLAGEVTEPLAYYFRSGPFGQMFALMDKRMPEDARVEILGLGAGATACYARPREHWVFREIDPLVERMARDTRYFHFLERCGAGAQVVLGDARITLDAAPAQANLIVLDVFSSDSVPVHLLTREALQGYFAHLRPGGVVAFHVSNRYLNLVPVLARLAESLGAPVRHRLQLPGADGQRKLGAEMVVLAPPGGSLADFAAAGWDEPKAGPVLWTDDKSDIYRVIRW